MGAAVNIEGDLKADGDGAYAEELDRQPDNSMGGNAPTTFRTGGLDPQRVLGGVADESLGHLELEALFDGLSIGTRHRYLKGWKQWRTFCDARKITPLIDTTTENWGVGMLNFIMYESLVLRLAPSATLGKLRAIRYEHIVSGKADFTPCGLRCKLMLSGMGRSRLVTGLLPFNTDLVNWVWGNVASGETSITARELWCAWHLWFFFTMCGSELGNMRMQDARSAYKESVRTITIRISRSKTDQLGVGSFRTLSMADLGLCHVAATSDYLNWINWNGQPAEFLFSESMRGRLHALTKWAVSCNGLKTARFGVRSLRSGGATARYVSGVPLDDIRRFGRWKSCVFHIYIHRDELMYHGSSRHISRTEGFLGQLKQTNSATKAARADEESLGTDFRTGMVGHIESGFSYDFEPGSAIFESGNDSENIANRHCGTPRI